MLKVKIKVNQLFRCRPYYGRPSRPTTARPRPMSLNINMEDHEVMMEDRVETMRDTCDKYGEDIMYPKRVFSNHR